MWQFAFSYVVHIAQVEDLPQPFNAISYLMVARYAVQATVVNEFSCTTKAWMGEVEVHLPTQLVKSMLLFQPWLNHTSRPKCQTPCHHILAVAPVSGLPAGCLQSAGVAKCIGRPV